MNAEIRQELDRLENPRRPVRFPEFPAAANLPSPVQYRSCVAFLKSIDRLVVSNGTNWLRVDTGATV